VISTRAKQTAYLLAFAEGMLLSLAFSSAFAVRALVPLPALRDGVGIDFNVHAWLLTIGIPLYWLLAWAHKLYDPAAIRGRSTMLLSMTKVFTYLTTILGLAIFLFQAKAFSRAVFFLFLAFGLVFVVVNRLALAAIAGRTRIDADDLRNVLVVGTGHEAVEVRTKLAVHRELAMRVVGHLTGPTPAPMAVDAGEILGSLSDLKRIVEERVVDDVVFAIPVAESLACEREIGWCEEVGVTVHLRVDLVRTLFARM
jgi:FlaA1/EpsC-like NDP-sugar epimerase